MDSQRALRADASPQRPDARDGQDREDEDDHRQEHAGLPKIREAIAPWPEDHHARWRCVGYLLCSLGRRD